MSLFGKCHHPPREKNSLIKLVGLFLYIGKMYDLYVMLCGSVYVSSPFSPYACALAKNIKSDTHVYLLVIFVVIS